MASQPIYQFYAELKDYEPKIWRRFQVMNNITMARLGYILMTLFEMQAGHLFCFDVHVIDNLRKSLEGRDTKESIDRIVDMFQKNPKHSELRVELIDEDSFFGFEGRVLDAAETKVKHILTEKMETMTFSYDYGDGWEIELILEETDADKELSGNELPRVLEGEGYGIIEDCGGPGGLQELTKAFKEKKGPQYQRYTEWLGVDELDLSSFDLEDMNFRLKKVPRIYKDVYEHGLKPTRQSINLLMREYKKYGIEDWKEE